MDGRSDECTDGHILLKAMTSDETHAHDNSNSFSLEPSRVTSIHVNLVRVCARKLLPTKMAFQGSMQFTLVLIQACFGLEPFPAIPDVTLIMKRYHFPLNVFSIQLFGIFGQIVGFDMEKGLRPMFRIV